MLKPEREREVLEAIRTAFLPFTAAGEVYDYGMRIRLKVLAPEPLTSERLTEDLGLDRELVNWLRSVRRLLRERGYELNSVSWDGN